MRCSLRSQYCKNETFQIILKHSVSFRLEDCFRAANDDEGLTHFFFCTVSDFLEIRYFNTNKYREMHFKNDQSFFVMSTRNPMILLHTT